MNLTKALKIIHNQVDGQVKKAVRHTERVENMKVQCRRGCNHCCKFMVQLTVTEAIEIYRVLGDERVKELLPKLKHDAELMADRKMTLGAWTERWKACHLLTDAGECSVYAQRPLACRSHVSFSPPEKCDDPNGKTHMLAAAHPICGYYTSQMHQNGLPAAMAPLQYQLLLLYYIETHADSDKAYTDLLKTSALDFKASISAWSHLLEDPNDEMAGLPIDSGVPIVPLWEWV